MSEPYVGDLHFLAVSLLKYNMEVLHVAVMTYIHRNNECEAADIVDDVGISKSRVFRVLHYLHNKGVVRYRLRKDADRQVVKAWRLTEDGKRAVTEMERLYKAYQIRSVRHACFTAGKEVPRG